MVMEVVPNATLYGIPVRRVVIHVFDAAGNSRGHICQSHWLTDSEEMLGLDGGVEVVLEGQVRC